MRTWGQILATLCLALGPIGCARDVTFECGELTCPGGLVCAEKSGRCVRQEEIDVCAAVAESGSCSTTQIPNGTCSLSVCESVVCGDGVRAGNEVCDDGNRLDGDGCSRNCDSDERCGNDILDEAADETCDDGNSNDGDGCSSECTPETCGDGVVDAERGEVCDDGSTVPGDGCSRDCTSNEECGNGIIDEINEETCDDGNLTAGDGCSAGCKVEGCGNGRLEEERGEVCDDANDVSGDGCRSDCRKIEVCGDGEVDAGESCDDGNDNEGDLCDSCQAVSWNAEVVVGQELSAPDSFLRRPLHVAMDREQNVYVADAGNSRIRKVNLDSGRVETIVGRGYAGYSNDGNYGASTLLYGLEDLDVDDTGAVYFTERLSKIVRKFDPSTGLVNKVAGLGSADGLTDESAPALFADLTDVNGLAVDGIGNVYLTQDDRVRLVSARTGTIHTLAGSFGIAGDSGDWGDAEDALLNAPADVEVDSLGNVFFADRGNHRVRYIEVGTGRMGLHAGKGSAGLSGDDGHAPFAELNAPEGIAVTDEAVYIADTGNHVVRKVDRQSWEITTVAGNGEEGFSGDGGPPLEARLDAPTDVAVDAQGNLVIVDRGCHCVRWVVPGQDEIRTIVGRPEQEGRDLVNTSTSVALGQMRGLFVDSSDDLYAADTSGNAVYRITPDGIIDRVAGTGVYGETVASAVATTSDIAGPVGVLALSNGDLVFTEATTHRIRLVDAITGELSVLAGISGTAGYSGDDGPAIDAVLNSPWSLTEGPDGDVYFSDTLNHVVRKIELSSGLIRHVAGTGTPGFGGDEGEARLATLNRPRGIVFDSLGHLFVADASNNRVRRIDASSSVITTIVGDGSSSNSGDGGDAGAARIFDPWDLAVDVDDNLFIAIRVNHHIRKIDRSTGVIDRVAGQFWDGNAGDGGDALDAQFTDPYAVAVDSQGALYISDAWARVRKVDPLTNVVSTAAGLVELFPTGSLDTPDLRLGAPAALVPGSDLTWVSGSFTVQAIDHGKGTYAPVAGWYPQNVSTGDLALFRDRFYPNVTGLAYDESRGVLYFTEAAIAHANESPEVHAKHDFHRVNVLHVDKESDPSTWTLSVLAGSTFGHSDGAGPEALFAGPAGLLLDGDTLWVADSWSNTIREIDLSAGLEDVTVTTVAGTPLVGGFEGDGGPATLALLKGPTSLARCPGGDIYFADEGNARVRRLEPNGRISTVLGTGANSIFGEGAPATEFPVASPKGIACDPTGNVFVTSRSTVRMLGADDAGAVDGTGAVATIFGAADEGSFAEDQSRCLTAIAMKSENVLQMTDGCSGLLIELSRSIQ